MTVLKAGETWAVLANGMGSTNLGGVGSLFAASRLGPNAEIFAGGTYRKQSAYRDGDGTVIPNTGNEIWTGTAKGTFRPAEGHQFKLGYISFDADYKTGQPYAAGTPPPSASIYATNTRNEIATGRWTYSRPDDWLFNFDANVYWTKTATDQQKIDGTPSVASGRLGDTRNFTLSTRGFDVNNTTRFDLGNSHHALNYGADSFRDEVDTTGFGTVCHGHSGERTVSGAFRSAQVATSPASSRPSRRPRYDTYALQGGGNYNDGNHLSPKSTVAFTAVDGFAAPYVTYAEGSRAPALTETAASPASIRRLLDAAIHAAAQSRARSREESAGARRSSASTCGIRWRCLLRAGDEFRAQVQHVPERRHQLHRSEISRPVPGADRAGRSV